MKFSDSRTMVLRSRH